MNPQIDGQHPSWRIWGEEKLEDAIYMVYLKKVRYHTPATKEVDSDPEDLVSHLEWETVRIRIIKAGTLPRLVEGLTTDTGQLDSTFVNIFLATYRTFSTPLEVLSLILDRYKMLSSKSFFRDMPKSVKEKHCGTLIQILLVWLDLYQDEDFKSLELLSLLVDFAEKYQPNSPLLHKARERLELLQSNSYNSDCSDMDLVAFLTQNLRISRPPPSLNFLDIPEDFFARQLTWLDSELFRRVLPHQCLGAVWSRDRLAAPSVAATVRQFNAVSLRVLTVLLSPKSSHQRAPTLIKWINIAQELRFLKNFSSLKAITAALQSNSIFRLRRLWQQVPKEKVEVFSELARIFSEDNNLQACRELLLKEGTAKFAATIGENDRQLQKIFQKQMANNKEGSSRMEGTVPYLGTFLTDLTMLDAAVPDRLPNGLLNFDKRRKEFELLAQLKLLQGAANNYSIPPDLPFQAWFHSLPLYDDNHYYELSCQIEQPPEKKVSASPQKSLGNGHRKCDSTSSTASTGSSSTTQSQFYDIIDVVDTPKAPSVDSGSSSGPQQPEFYIIRVSLQEPGSTRSPTEGLNLYKAIMLSNRERTREVKYNAMMKHGVVGNPDDYTLAQLLPDGEMVLPNSANVYYAMNTSYDLNFILRPLKSPS